MRDEGFACDFLHALRAIASTRYACKPHLEAICAVLSSSCAR